jgi:hypothetical protein
MNARRSAVYYGMDCIYTVLLLYGVVLTSITNRPPDKITFSNVRVIISSRNYLLFLEQLRISSLFV